MPTMLQKVETTPLEDMLSYNQPYYCGLQNGNPILGFRKLFGLISPINRPKADLLLLLLPLHAILAM
jgi:hypothetical protein